MFFPRLRVKVSRLWSNSCLTANENLTSILRNSSHATIVLKKKTLTLIVFSVAVLFALYKMFPLPGLYLKKIPAFFLPAEAYASAYKQKSPRTRILTNTNLKQIEFLERYCFDKINNEREANDLPPLKFFDKLLPVARRYSKRMAEESFFSHVDPSGLSLDYRLAEANIKVTKRGENLSRIGGYIDTVPAVVNGWMKSDSHRKNILDHEFDQSAVGVWISDNDLTYFTQILVKR